MSIRRPAPVRRRVVAAALTAAVAGALLAGASPAGGAPQTDAVPLAEIGAPPTDGTLENQVEWSVDVGTGAFGEQGYIFVSGQTQTWTFDRPVSLAFGIAGLNCSPEGSVLPAGTEAVTIDGSHTWDAAMTTLEGGGAPAGAESTFTLAGVTELAIANTGQGGCGHGLTFLEVAYNFPVAVITGPQNGGSFVEGGGETLQFACEDGTGDVTGTATINGQPIAAGAPIDQLGPGTHTIEVTCTDEFGATHTTSVTFQIAAADSGTPPAPAVVVTPRFTG